MSCLPGMPCYGGTLTPTGTNCGADPCDNKLKASNLIKYIGPNLPCTDINTCDDLTTIIQKLEQIICNLQDCCGTTTTTTTCPCMIYQFVGADAIFTEYQYTPCNETTPTTINVGSISVYHCVNTNYPVQKTNSESGYFVNTGACCTTTTTTTALQLPGVVNSICIGCNSETTSQDACAFGAAAPLECSPLWYDLANCPTLTVGCKLFLDPELTIPFVGTPGEFCSNAGINWFEIGANGIILSMGSCPSPPPQPTPELHCNNFIIPLIDGTPFNVGGVSVTCTYTGDVTTLSIPWTIPGTLDVFPANSVWLGKNCGPVCDPFTFTFNFNSPVNSITLYQAGGDIGENYTYVTNNGAPTITTSYISSAIVGGNVILCDSNVVDGKCNVLFTITDIAPFTSLTISGFNPTYPNGAFGSVFAICDSIVPSTTTTTTTL